MCGFILDNWRSDSGETNTLSILYDMNLGGLKTLDWKFRKSYKHLVINSHTALLLKVYISCRIWIIQENISGSRIQTRIIVKGSKTIIYKIIKQFNNFPESFFFFITASWSSLLEIFLFLIICSDSFPRALDRIWILWTWNIKGILQVYLRNVNMLCFKSKSWNIKTFNKKFYLVRKVLQF